MIQSQEGVTIKYSIREEPFKTIDSIDCIVEKIKIPLNSIEEENDVVIQDKIIWGEVYEGNASIAINIQGTLEKIESSLIQIINEYDLPSIILKKSQLFANGDTDKGIDLTKSVIEQLGGKVTKRKFPYLGYGYVKFFIRKA